jgi:hypothetical protein
MEPPKTNMALTGVHEAIEIRWIVADQAGNRTSGGFRHMDEE